MRTLHTLLLPVAAVIACVTALGQDPQVSAPKTPAPAKPVSALARSPYWPMPVESVDDARIQSLKGIAVFDNYTQATKVSLAGISNVTVFGPGFLRNKEFATVMGGALHRPLGDQGMKTILSNVVIFCRLNGHIVVDALFPERELTDEVLPIVLLEGKVSKINVVVNNRTNQQYDTKGVLRWLRTQPGQPVLQDKLLGDMDWLQRVNPFREVYRVSFQQAKYSDTNSTTDLEVDIWERYPWPLDFEGRDRLPGRFYAGVENSGNRVLGEERVLAGLNWTKLWGLDHQVNYQFVSSLDFDQYLSQAGSYIVPFPWRHSLMLYGSYANMNPDLTQIGVPSVFDPSQKGETYQVSLRYMVPLPRARQYSHEFSVGFDYKNANSNLEFGGLRIVSTPTEIGQFVLEYRGFLPDRLGQTAFDVNGFYSPGGLFQNDTTLDYQRMRLFAKADYYYFHANLERQFKLPVLDNWLSKDVRDNYALAVQLLGQYASGNLLPSEEQGLGGYATVRGYEERLFNGDDAIVVRTELRSPFFQLSKKGFLFRPHDQGLSLQGLAFLDYGTVHLSEVLPGEPDQHTLMSAGVGLRATAAQNLALRLDWGYQLEHVAVETEDWRFCFSAVLSF
jgi:hemolysin activation/secretion protein